MSSSSSSAAAAASVPFQSPRKVVKKVLSLSQSEGQGATVRRSIGGHEVRNLDPFLLLDEFSVSKPGGFPDGVQKGLQLWINLASKDKMIEPRYQELESKDISQAEKDGVAVRIIAGEAFGVRSPVYTRTPTMYMDFTMQPGSQLHQPIPEGWNAVVYIIEGEGVFGKEGAAPASAHHCLVLGAGDGLSVWNRSGAPLRFALAAGQPLNEPVVQQGPFVMNSRAQIQQAMEDYYYGRNGFEKASQWSSA
ncbi:unnamed protein product [Triticum turgidum subsp. durum]|uniref:Pirin C-terminal domain-containing protein n=1 Tax=Triticum turgidum subsp. durum TaxID=4567 RepID=A0A9R0W344_TRITD|nr:unnamed protein product [Triticum turgidum subsp. durum]